MKSTKYSNFSFRQLGKLFPKHKKARPTEKDILLNKEDKIFYNIISDNLIFFNPEKYVEVIRKCRK